MENSMMMRLEEDLEKARLANNGRRVFILLELQHELERNATARSPVPEADVVASLYDRTQKELSRYEDYVTGDHGLMKVQYKNDLTVLRDYLG